jgi:mono/diheme cytochrome c family protein
MTRILFPILLSTTVACSGSQAKPDGPSGDDGSSGPSTTSTTGSTEPSTGETSSTTGGGTSGTGGAGGSTGAGGTTPGAQTQTQMVAAGDTARGAKLYDENHCAGCHGTPEKPPKKFPNLFKVDFAADKEIAEAFELIKKGKTPMPGFDDKLDDKAIADIVAYLKANKS